MTTQNPELVRVQDIPRSYISVSNPSSIKWLRNKFSIKQQYNYLFFKSIDNDIVSLYGSYGHNDVCEIYHVVGEVIQL